MLPSSTDDSMLEDPVKTQLDTEVASLKEQIAFLKSQRALQASAILSSRTTQSILTRLRASQKSSETSTPKPETDTTPLLTASSAQQSHNQQNLYRACASITSFRIRDPDPNAVDNGNVLGLRIDISSVGKFVKPYYVMLNKPFDGENKDLLRIHRHTIPPCIPLASLADRYLPHGKGVVAFKSGNAVEGSKMQDLRLFVRALRRELMGYHNRISAIKNLRREFRLDEKVRRKGKERERVIADVSAADAEAKQIRIEWVDGRIGRVLIDEKGMVDKCVIIGEEGRDREVERSIVGQNGNGSMLGIGDRLKEGIY